MPAKVAFGFLLLAAAPCVLADNGEIAIGDANCRIINPQPRQHERVTWSGPCKAGYAEGSGIEEWYVDDALASRYEGEMTRGLIEGRGKMEFTSGGEYVGQFHEGKLDGKGVLVQPNGLRITGNFHDDDPVGNVLVEGKNGFRYEGAWIDGKMEGTGKVWYSDGSRYAGEFKNGDRNGTGVAEFGNGARYEGTWRDSKFEGTGKLRTTDGGTYAGQFSEGVRQGSGVYLSSHGERFEGAWENNVMNGQGTAQYRDGSRYEGAWRNGQYDGEGKLRLPDGSVYQGSFQLGRREGEGTLTDAKGRRISGTWSNNFLVHAQDDPAARAAAADRYLQVAPISRMVDEMLQSVAHQVPADKQSEFLAQLKSAIHADRLDQIARDTLTRHFTTEELEALAEFYGSPSGASVVPKLKTFSADIVPQVQAELQRAAREVMMRKSDKDI